MNRAVAILAALVVVLAVAFGQIENPPAGFAGTVPVSQGGTGATNIVEARRALGFQFLRPDTNSVLTWTNSTNWQTIPGLTWPAEIGAAYLVEGVIRADESANGEWQLQFDGAILFTPEMGWWLQGGSDPHLAGFEAWPVTPTGSVEAFKFRFLITATNTNIAVQIDVHVEDTNSVLEVLYSTWLTVESVEPTPP